MHSSIIVILRTKTGQPTHWFKTLDQYYYRDEWELFDLQADPKELNNLAHDPDHQKIFQQMNHTLFTWQAETNDAWRCMPHSILLGSQCHDMMNHDKVHGMNYIQWVFLTCSYLHENKATSSEELFFSVEPKCWGVQEQKISAASFVIQF